jgi:hypothetical protein
LPGNQAEKPIAAMGGPSFALDGPPIRNTQREGGITNSKSEISEEGQVQRPTRENDV